MCGKAIFIFLFSQYHFAGFTCKWYKKTLHENAASVTIAEKIA
jgi:hypothetical protein